MALEVDCAGTEKKGVTYTPIRYVGHSYAGMVGNGEAETRGRNIDA